MGCSIEADPNVWEARLPNGLVKGHAYSITGMRIVNNTPLLRIRNPWGNEQEWRGAWSDNSREWQSVSDDEKRDMNLNFEHDGEFWMSFQDFMREFEKLEICNLGPEVMGEIEQMTGVAPVTSDLTWNVGVHDGSWIANQTAGGCRNFINTFADNPQFVISLQDADPDDADDLCTCVIAVLQKYRRLLRSEGLDNLSIGFAVYELERGSGRQGQRFFQMNKACARSPVFINLREVTTRVRMPPGTYCIIPTTFDPNEEGDFMVRIFTNGLVQSQAV